MNDHSYIRGAGGRIEGKRMARLTVGACGLALAILAVVLLVQAVHENTRSSTLQRHGVPIEVTVSSCVGLASGTGITESGYRCTTTLSLDGRSYAEVLGGTDALYQPGQKVGAVVDRNDPSNLMIAPAAARNHESWSAFIPGAATLLALVVLMLVLLLARRGRRVGLERS